MRAVVQRVRNASVTIDGEIVQIGPGLLCLIGLRDGDTPADAEFIARKILNMRLWASERKAWDLSVTQQGFEVLCVSQFTLFGRLNGNKPDFSKAMPPQDARDFYHEFLERLRRDYSPEKVLDGRFGAKMDVQLVNDGPVTFILDSEKPANGSVASLLDDL